METETLNLTGKHAIKRGTIRRLALTFENADGTPFDFENVSAIAKIAPKPGVEAIEEFTPIFSNRAGGLLILVLNQSQTLALIPGVYWWELYLVLADSDTVCPLEGQLEIRDNIR